MDWTQSNILPEYLRWFSGMRFEQVPQPSQRIPGRIEAEVGHRRERSLRGLAHFDRDPVVVVNDRKRILVFIVVSDV
jgi:hypothetical protein